MRSRFIKIRKIHNLTQKQFSEKLCVSKSLISIIESGAQSPSLTLIELIVYKFNINRNWITHGSGEIFSSEQKKENNSTSVASKAMALAAVAGPVMPQVTLGIMASVGASHIIQKMVKAYGAKNSRELAENHLNISNSTIYSWRDKKKIPDKYIKQASKDTGIPVEYLISDESSLFMDKKVYFDFIKSLNDPAKFNDMDYDQKSSILEQYLKNLGNQQS
ncbi:MAG: helix-turn-helix domain-containing protein [Deltaproteobacteria bacterium]|nr:helix-turn-helix domain-containing protein [Deltaproteobacteria bacterium]